MNLLPKTKQKRNQLVLTLGGALLLVVGLGFGLVRPQYAKLAGIKKETIDTEKHLDGIRHLVQESDAGSNQLREATLVISNAEADMATGDIYAWTVDTMRHFKANYKVDVPEIGQPTVGDVDLFPHFAYKQIRFSLHGTGYYHDIGKFIADLEDKFPHMRVINIEMSPVGTDSEKLTFSMEIIALVKASS